MKKMISVALVMLMLFTALCGVASAETAVTPRASNYFHSYGVNLGDAGNGKLSITFHCVGLGICSTLGVASYEVEKLTDEGWVNVSGLLDGQTGSNCASYTYGRYFNGVSGETYRLNVTFICVLNGGAETKTFTSGTITMD